MIAFIYNNNMHASTNKTPQNLLIKYIINLNNAFKNRIFKKKTSFVIKRAKWLRNIKLHLQKLWKKISKQ